ncbi:hypothetical protein GLOIN_2v1485806 [Rhizophagus irregularis DAOM 181602=DAOM 197198]|uniref:Uncharacterized protein n=1 Tax=Rhizophagus irregularis (strain DAOM 181602 / DAOM 197198 / MUCL 43194) TaxID=747089 RepID=A0A2P4P9C6_RHIID|nr:hypothetical protein GLOIN_2v1485806 [Rhizophagus irregularis DAOM 181602=DAOM 197198]POG61981.1 hypothetical protein GLOIN_2v1485806 [Rhizophagus irregularis DAOM 181602=DAOM 197198]|eukprot:XP_025168847.1 hypothetical protein GLOIN_2v1485806 [Rhizophagus irregularis DAOM 181602=DAOM 197198]
MIHKIEKCIRHAFLSNKNGMGILIYICRLENPDLQHVCISLDFCALDRYRLIWIGKCFGSWIWYQFLQLWGTGSFGIGLRTLTSWTSLVGFLNIEQHLAVGQRLGVFSLRTISVFGGTFGTKGTP